MSSFLAIIVFFTSLIALTLVLTPLMIKIFFSKELGND